MAAGLALQMRVTSIRLRVPLVAASVLLCAGLFGIGASPSDSRALLGSDPLAKINTWQIADAGCCSGFSWSDDGATIAFFDADQDGRRGLWQLDLITLHRDFESAAPVPASPSGRYLIERTATPNSARITDTLLDRTWDFRLGGPNLRFSPLEDRVVFSVRSQGFLPDFARMASIYTARVDGSDSTLVTSMFGRPIGWFPDGKRLLLSGRQTLNDPAGIWVYDLKTNELDQIVIADFVRRASISPAGRFVAFVRSLAEDPSDSGIWLYDTATGRQRRVADAGSYLWHPSGRGLLIIPPRPHGQGDHAIWWADIAGAEMVSLTGPGSNDLRVSNYEWRLSPDGRRVVYRHADDLSLWIVDFGEALDQVFGGWPSSFDGNLADADPTADWDFLLR